MQRNNAKMSMPVFRNSEHRLREWGERKMGQRIGELRKTGTQTSRHITLTGSKRSCYKAESPQ